MASEQHLSALPDSVDFYDPPSTSYPSTYRPHPQSSQPPEAPSPPRLLLVSLIVTLCTIGLVAAVLVASFKCGDPPAENDKDLSNPTGWVAVAGAVLVFGSYGILIKLPSVQNAHVNTMIFQVHALVAALS